MYKKKAFVLWVYLSLLALVACGPKVIDDSDVVSMDYVYKFADGTIVDQWNAEFIVWDNSEFQRLESVIRWAKLWDEFNWTINWKVLYSSEYDNNMVQSYPNLVMREVLWIIDPKVWDTVSIEPYGEWVILSETEDEDWYMMYFVDFNDPKTFSDLLYFASITNIEKK